MEAEIEEFRSIRPNLCSSCGLLQSSTSSSRLELTSLTSGRFELTSVNSGQSEETIATQADLS